MKTFTRRYSWLIENHAFQVFCVFFGLLGFIVPGAIRAVRSNTNDVKDWLPDAYQETSELLWYHEHFGAGSDHAVVVSWPAARLKGGSAGNEPNWRDLVGGDAYRARLAEWEQIETLQQQGKAGQTAEGEASAEAAEALELRRQLFMAAPLADERVDLFARKLLARPDLFKGVMTGPQLLVNLTGPPLNLPPDEAMKRLQGTVFGPQYLQGLRLTEHRETGLPIIDEVEIDSPAGSVGLPEGVVVESINGVATPNLRSAQAELIKTYRVDRGTLAVQLAGETEPRSWEWSGPLTERTTCVIVPLAARESREAYWNKQAEQRKLPTKKELINTMAELQRVAVEECDIAAEDLRMGGPPVDNLAIDREGEESLRRLANMSFGVGFLLCLICFRNFKLTMIVFCTAIFSEFTSLAVVWYSGVKVDAILLSMPSLIYVLTISGAIHIVNYYRDAVSEAGLKGAPARAVMKAITPCTLAALTTAIGLASLYMSDLVPIRKFGLYSAIATMVSLAWLYLFLPAALTLWPLNEKDAEALRQRALAPPREGKWGRFWMWWGDKVLNHGGLVFGVFMIATVVLGYGAATQMKTTVKLMKLFDEDARIIRDYAWIESKLAALVPMEVVVHTRNEARVVVEGSPHAGTFELRFEGSQLDEAGIPLEKSTGPLPFNVTGRRLEQALHKAGLPNARVHTTGHTPNVVHRITSDRPIPWFELDPALASGTVRMENRDGMLENVRFLNRIRRRVESLEHVDTTLSVATFMPTEVESSPGYLFDAEVEFQLRKAAARFEKAGYLRFDPETGEELYRISLRMSAFDDVDYSRFVSQIKQAVDPLVMLEPLSGKEGWEAAELTAGGTEGVDFAYVNTDGSRASVRDVNGLCTVAIDGQEVFAGRRQDLPTAATYTGIVPLVYKAQNELLIGLLKSYAVAFALIAGVMVILSGSLVGLLYAIPAGVLLMLPNFFPTAVVFGSLTWSGFLVDIGTMMTASVALGVAVDDTVHYLAWFNRGIRQGLNRKDAARMAYKHCAVAMVQTTVIAGAGMFVFAASSFTPTARFGMLMVPLMFAALIGDLVMLPAILVSWVGKMFGGSGARKSGQKDHATVGADANTEAQPLPQSAPQGSAPVSGPSSDRRKGSRASLPKLD